MKTWKLVYSKPLEPRDLCSILVDAKGPYEAELVNGCLLVKNMVKPISDGATVTEVK